VSAGALGSPEASAPCRGFSFVAVISGSVKSELFRAGLGLSLPVVERATPGTEEANAAEASRACRIGDTRADF
jgi:hypothetical protein